MNGEPGIALSRPAGEIANTFTPPLYRKCPFGDTDRFEAALVTIEATCDNEPVLGLIRKVVIDHVIGLRTLGATLPINRNSPLRAMPIGAFGNLNGEPGMAETAPDALMASASIEDVFGSVIYRKFVSSAVFSGAGDGAGVGVELS